MPYGVRLSHSSLAVAMSVISFPGLAQDAPSSVWLAPLVVTAASMDNPYTVTADTRDIQSGMPAQDGGAYLKNIPGFSVSRKGGTSGDPELRGLGGSRLNILANDTRILGGCGGRMDPPTAYIYPQNYDRIEVIKGPQSVRYGVSPAGSVRFERDKPELTERVTEGFASFTLGSAKRTDLMTELMAGDQQGYLRLLGTLSDQANYKDGDGQRIHSEYHRWSTTALLGWTPDKDTRIELSYDRSDGYAAYDDRGMDGSRFDRTGYQLSAARKNLSPLVSSLELGGYYNYVDHVMDNFTLRQPPGMPMISYPDRTTIGGYLHAELIPADGTLMMIGVDFSDNEHRSNRLMGMPAFGWRDVPREDNARFRERGLFAELEQTLSDQQWLTLGVRADYHQADAEQDGFGGADLGERVSDTLWSGFVRYEHALSQRPVNLYAGLGHAARAPDFWERRRVFDIKHEKLTQLDAGVSLNGLRWRGSLSVFYGHIDDYILIIRPGLEATEARNIDVITFGAEADLTWRITDLLSATGALSAVRSRNDSDNRALAQTPPMEGSLSVDYADGRHYGGARIRGVMAQHRVDPGYGTIYSLDTDKSSGFGTLSLYAGVNLMENTRLTLGVDNLFDRAYAEHIQRGSAELGAATGRINEPGRLLWANVSMQL